MNALEKYVERKNVFRTLRDSDLIVVPKSGDPVAPRNAAAFEIFGMLAGDLSPENLHCDGEITAAAARKKARKLNAAWKLLEIVIGRRFDEIELYSL